MTSQSLTTNPNYLVTISRGGAGGEGFGNLSIVANAAAKLSLAVDNRWVTVMEALGLSGEGGMFSSIFNAAQLATGENLAPVILSAHVWRSSSGIEISLEMRFDAYNDPVTDVLKPVETLIAMFSPVRGGTSGVIGTLSSIMEKVGVPAAAVANNQFLQPPGPTPASYLLSKGNDPKAITVTLGKVLTITNLIPLKLSWEFENRFTSSGDPICAVVSASFMSYTIPALDDIMKFFQGGSANQGVINSILAKAGSSENINTNIPMQIAAPATTGALPIDQNKDPISAPANSYDYSSSGGRPPYP